MREKYESLSAAVLKDLAKHRGIKGVTGMKKSEVVEAMLRQDEIDAENAKAAATEEKTAKPETDAADENTKPADEDSQKTAEKAERPTGKGQQRPQKGRDGKVRLGRKRIAKPETAEQNEIAGQTETAADEKPENKTEAKPETKPEKSEGESREDELKDASGILEIMPDGFGFLRSDNYLPGENDVYVSPSQIRRFNMRTGDVVTGKTKRNNPNDKFAALIYVSDMNGYDPETARRRTQFEDLTPIFPNERIRLEYPGASVAMRIVDLVSPIGKGQRGMIVSQPKAGKTTLLKQIAKSVLINNPEMHLIILLIDERPEEVTDMKEAIRGNNVEVIYSTFDELPEHHKRVSEMTIERAKRLVEHGQDVMILLDSITRLARAYNLTVPPSGRTLSGGLDPAALHMPKRFFGAARNMREGGSLTILATALVETGSKMDDVVFEEFKGTGNMELVLDRKLSEKRVFPAIDITRSSTRREDLLLDASERATVDLMRRGLNGMKKDEAVENILNAFAHTHNNQEYIKLVTSRRIF